jgi:proline iminopeptidase
LLERISKTACLCRRILMRMLLLTVIIALVGASFPGCTRGGKVDAVNAEMIPLKNKVITGYVSGKGGVKLFVRIEGNGSPTLVIPGGPGYSFDYLLPVLSELDSSNQMIYFDPRGCGRSDRFKNPGLYTLDNMVADVESLRTHLNISALNIIGHETGGMLAEKYAIKYPTHVNRLILMSTTAQVSDLTIWLNSFRDFMPRQIAALVKMYEKDSLFTDGRYSDAYERTVLSGIMIPNYFTNAASVPTDFSLPERSWPVYLEMWGRTGYFDISGNLKDFDVRNDLKTLKIKTLILVGQNDYISPFVMESLGSSIPKAKMHTFDGAGHFYYIEKPDEFLSTVKEFLAN